MQSEEIKKENSEIDWLSMPHQLTEDQDKMLLMAIEAFSTENLFKKLSRLQKCIRYIFEKGYEAGKNANRD